MDFARCNSGIEYTPNTKNHLNLINGTWPALIVQQSRGFSPIFHAVMRVIIISFCMSSVVFGVAKGASFDCTKAILEVEVAICADKELSGLDDELGDVYRRALSRHKNKEAIRSQQKAWLDLIRNRVNKFDLKQAYFERIKLLNSQEPLLTKISGEFNCKIELFKDKPGVSSERRLELAVSEGKVVAFDWYAILIPLDPELRVGSHYRSDMRLSHMNYIDRPGYVSLQNNSEYENQPICDVAISKHGTLLHVHTVGCGLGTETTIFDYVFEQKESSCVFVKE